MNIKNGRIKNINKKLIAGILAFTLVAIPLSGCDDVSIDNISYKASEEGNLDFVVDREILKYCSFCRVYNNKINKEYYTISFMDEYNGSYFIKYYDIFTKEEIKVSENAFKNIGSVNNYLDEIGRNQEIYTSAELSEILDLFCTKQKVKVK